jgi:Rod binding domain-containing protein
MSGLAPIDRAMLPADVRQGPKADRDRYVAALSFERQLVHQLAKQLSETAGSGDEDSSSATKVYRDMLPDALADAVAQGGGLGLARQIADSMKDKTSTTEEPAA